jgi:hypothetical protein
LRGNETPQPILFCYYVFSLFLNVLPKTLSFFNKNNLHVIMNLSNIIITINLWLCY